MKTDQVKRPPEWPVWWLKIRYSKHNLWAASNELYIFSSTLVGTPTNQRYTDISATDISLMLYWW